MVALALFLVAGAATYIQIDRNRFNLEQAVVVVQAAHFTRHLPNSSLCQNTVYDNKTDRLLEDTFSRCLRERRGMKPPLKFNWGG
jgi:hypothetical protein